MNNIIVTREGNTTIATVNDCKFDLIEDIYKDMRAIDCGAIFFKNIKDCTSSDKFYQVHGELDERFRTNYNFKQNNEDRYLRYPFLADIEKLYIKDSFTAKITLRPDDEDYADFEKAEVIVREMVIKMINEEKFRVISALLDSYEEHYDALIDRLNRYDNKINRLKYDIKDFTGEDNELNRETDY